MTEVANNYLPDKIEGGSGNPELVSAQNGPVSRISRFIRSKTGRIAAGIIFATAGAGAALSACTPDRPDKPAGIYSTRTGALDLTQVPNIGPGQPIPWSLKGGSAQGGGVLSYAKINDNHYLFVGQSVAENKTGGIQYIQCKDMVDCLSANAKLQAVQGLIAAGLPYETVYDSSEPDKPYNYVPAYSPAVFQDADGSNKLLVIGGDDDYVRKCGIATNANAVLEASKCAKLNPPILDTPTVFVRDNHPYALWNKGYFAQRRDLQTGNDTILTPPLNINWTNDCGFGFEGDTDPVTNKPTFVVGVERFKFDLFKPYCRLVTGKNWQEMNDNPIPLDVLNKDSNNVAGPILAGNYFFYGYATTTGYDGKDQAMYAPIPPAPQNPEPDAVDTKATDANKEDAGLDIQPNEVTPIPEVSPETTAPLDEVTPAPEVAFETTTPPDQDAATDMDADEVTPAPEVSPETTTPPDSDTAPDLSQELPKSQDAGQDVQPVPDTTTDLGQELPKSQDAGQDVQPVPDTAPDSGPDTQANPNGIK